MNEDDAVVGHLASCAMEHGTSRKVFDREVHFSNLLPSVQDIIRLAIEEFGQCGDVGATGPLMRCPAVATHVYEDPYERGADWKCAVHASRRHERHDMALAVAAFLKGKAASP